MESLKVSSEDEFLSAMERVTPGNTIIIRDGHNCIVEDNKLTNSSGHGIRVYGSGHLIQNNVIKNSSLNGIALYYGPGAGIEAKTHRIAATACTIKNNRIENAGMYGIFLGEGKGTDYSDHKNRESRNTGYIQDVPPSGNMITLNRIVNSGRAPIDTAGATDNTINEYK